uniref:V-type proton ATPase n=1 Tax=Anoplophora glabripennis TaxID=217634 RepID=V5GYH4_ANOGL
MSVCKSILVFLSVVLTISLVQCTEFVPVFMWSTSKTNEKVPALHKISQDSFKDDVLEHLKENPFVIVFAEQTLSPEDFAQHDQSGATVFPYLEKHKRNSKVSYLPYVQNPIKALKHLGEEVAEVSISDLKENFDFPATNILIVNLNDAKDDEHRLEMLKRHDSTIISIYNKIAKKYDNVLALYTAHHTSWVAPEDVISSRKIRSLLATTENGTYYKSNYSILYYTDVSYNLNNDASNTEVSLDFTDALQNTDIVLTGTSSVLQVEMEFSTNTSDGYWVLRNVTVTYNNTDYNLNSSLSDIYAPTTFSYHCGDQSFSTENNNFKLYFGSFQVQLFFDGTSANETKFSDAYDCVGFTSVPIWSGIFVSAILLLIMTLGITMMMDIRTMDRFDDAKGKTITINAE